MGASVPIAASKAIRAEHAVALKMTSATIGAWRK
jgi:hypothetical protein